MPDDVYLHLFRGSVLKGRAVCTFLKQILYDIGTEQCPLYLRMYSMERLLFPKFIAKFSYLCLLLPDDIEAPQTLPMIQRFHGGNGFRIVNELTAAGIHRAMRFGPDSVLEMVSDLANQRHPLPREQVLLAAFEVIYSFLFSPLMSIRMLRDGQRLAARILSRDVESPQLIDTILQFLFACAEDWTSHNDLIHSGVIPPLVKLLRASSASPIAPNATKTHRRCAIAALMHLTTGRAGADAVAAAAGGLAALVRLALDGSQSEASLAAEALANVATSGSSPAQAALLASGAAPAFVAAMRDAGPAALPAAEAAATLLRAGGADGAAAAAAFLASGAVPALLDLADGGLAERQTAAAAAIEALALVGGPAAASALLAAGAEEALVGLSLTGPATQRHCACAALMQLVLGGGRGGDDSDVERRCGAVLRAVARLFADLIDGPAPGPGCHGSGPGPGRLGAAGGVGAAGAPLILNRRGAAAGLRDMAAGGRTVRAALRAVGAVPALARAALSGEPLVAGPAADAVLLLFVGADRQQPSPLGDRVAAQPESGPESVETGQDNSPGVGTSRGEGAARTEKGETAAVDSTPPEHWQAVDTLPERPIAEALLAAGAADVLVALMRQGAPCEPGPLGGGGPRGRCGHDAEARSVHAAEAASLLAGGAAASPEEATAAAAAALVDALLAAGAGDALRALGRGGTSAQRRAAVRALAALAALAALEERRGGAGEKGISKQRVGAFGRSADSGLCSVVSNGLKTLDAESGGDTVSEACEDGDASAEEAETQTEMPQGAVASAEQPTRTRCPSPVAATVPERCSPGASGGPAISPTHSRGTPIRTRGAGIRKGLDERPWAVDVLAGFRPVPRRRLRAAASGREAAASALAALAGLDGGAAAVGRRRHAAAARAARLLVAGGKVRSTRTSGRLGGSASGIGLGPGDGPLVAAHGHDEVAQASPLPAGARGVLARGVARPTPWPAGLERATDPALAVRRED